MDDNQNVAPVENGSGAPEIRSVEKPKRGHKINLRSKKLWLTVAAIVLIGGLLAGGGLLYRKSDNLKSENEKLTSKVAMYKNALGSQTLQTVNKDNADATTSVDSGNDGSGGTAKQINNAMDSNGNAISGKYVGGTYAPFYLLNKYIVQIPDNIKMERDTTISTNGALQTYQNEGDGGCTIEGIVMDVDPTIYAPNDTFEAHGNSATYTRGIGCGGAYPATVAYAKYSNVPGITDQSYKYMEVVVFPCTSKNMTTNGDCKDNGYDASQWRLYSGLVLRNTKQYGQGDAIALEAPAVDLYNRDAYKVQFYISCPGSDGIRDCDYKGYKNGYQAALVDTNYTKLKNIILNMRSF